MAFFKSIAAPVAVVGTICGLLAIASSAEAAGRTAHLAAQQECDRRVQSGQIRYQSQYDTCYQQQLRIAQGLLYEGSNAGTFMDEFMGGIEEELGFPIF
tara:strand:+ start:625 stop:921 length:297 start_codon:yes stop_codon:yes gene_type:complete